MKRRSKPSARPSLPLIVALVAIATAAAAVAIHWVTSKPPAAVAPVQTKPEAGGKELGSPDAPVTIEVFSDFRCKYCGDLALLIKPKIVSEFVDKGTVRIVYRNFPVLGPVSEQAAEASECAADQRRFWAYHDALFARLSRGELRGSGDLDSAAKEVGLETARFAQCLRTGQTRQRVQADLDLGVRLGVRGTPTSFVDGQYLVGAQPVEVFREAIESARRR